MQTTSTTKPLTRREKEILACIGQGMTSQETAQHIHRSIKTVEAHRASITKKLSKLIPNINRVRIALWVRDNPQAVQP